MDARYKEQLVTVVDFKLYGLSKIVQVLLCVCVLRCFIRTDGFFVLFAVVFVCVAWLRSASRSCAPVDGVIGTTLNPKPETG